jgi:hypothetical protein
MTKNTKPRNKFVQLNSNRSNSANTVVPSEQAKERARTAELREHFDAWQQTNFKEQNEKNGTGGRVGSSPSKTTISVQRAKRTKFDISHDIRG